MMLATVDSKFGGCHIVTDSHVVGGIGCAVCASDEVGSSEDYLSADGLSSSVGTKVSDPGL